MAKYEPGDIATYYFVILEDEHGKRIQGWTDRKSLAEFYMKFHNCSNYRLKKVTKTIEEIRGITEENCHDEIILANIITRDRNKKGSEIKHIVVPTTETEIRFVNEECDTFFSGKVNYAYLDGATQFLKNKYQRALERLFLPLIISKAVYNRSDPYREGIELDQLMVLFRSFPTNFG